MRIGFTGTQRGMTPDQKRVLEDLLRRSDGEFHHGDCIGADAEAHDLAKELPYWIIVHPPVFNSKRAWKGGHEIRAPKDYLDRNKDIVAETERLVAAPGEPQEQLRSGTWSTIRHARKLKRRVYIIMPDGYVKCEGHDLGIVKEPSPVGQGS